MALKRGQSDVLLRVRLGLRVWGGDPRGRLPLSSHHIMGTCYQLDPSLLKVTSIPWGRGWHQSAFPTRFYPVNSCTTPCALTGSHQVEPTLKGRGVCSISVRGPLCVADLRLPPHLRV